MKPNGFTARLLIVACITAFPHAAFSQQDRLSLDYFKDYVFDAGRILAAPVHWEGGDWAKTGLVVGVAAGLYSADTGFRDAARRNQGKSGNDAAKIAERFGNGAYVAPALGAAYLYGHFTDSSQARRTGLYGMESFVLSGLFVNAMKMVGRRHRPYTGDPYNTWSGPGLSFDSDNLSFPSGHSAAAFSWATVVASEYREHALVPPLAYGIASTVALSRVYQDKHWASDIFFGSAVGYFTARAIIRYHAEDRQVTLLPFWGLRGGGLIGSYRFG